MKVRSVISSFIVSSAMLLSNAWAAEPTATLSAGKPAGLRQVADFLMIGDDFAVVGKGDFLDPFGQALALQWLQLVERPPVVLKAARQPLLGVGAEWAN